MLKQKNSDHCNKWTNWRVDFANKTKTNVNRISQVLKGKKKSLVDNTREQKRDCHKNPVSICATRMTILWYKWNNNSFLLLAPPPCFHPRRIFSRFPVNDQPCSSDYRSKVIVKCYVSIANSFIWLLQVVWVGQLSLRIHPFHHL